MKKKIISVLLVIALAVSVFGGCNLISTNTERDMAQIVATVTTTDNGETFTDNILKRDLVSFFNSTGYYYVQNYSYTYADTYQLLIDSLIERKIMLQEAKRIYGDEINPDGIGMAKYLEAWEIANAEYSVRTSVNELLDSFEKDIISNLKANLEDTDDEDTNETYLEWEGYKETLRTVPTAADEEEEAPEVTKDNYTDAEFSDYKINLSSISDLDGSTAETRKKAYNKMVNAIDYYNLLGESSFTNFEGSDFFQDELKSQMEQQLLNKYIDLLENKVTLDTADASADAVIKLTYSDIFARYKAKYDSQKTTYSASVSDYKTALEALTEDTYLLYNPYDGYGFVYNILIPFDAAQTYSLGILKNQTFVEGNGLTNEENYEIARKKLLKNVKGSDLRASWITNGYDYDTTTKLFGSKMSTDTDLYDDYEGYAFQGTAVKTDNLTTDGDNIYEISSTKMDLAQIIDKFTALLGTEATPTADFYDANNTELYLYTGKVNDNLDEARAKVNDFMFAYSTDTGCLNKYLGYSYPNSSAFVDEFSAACEYVIGEGAGAFAVVGTDYGWHIVYCTKVVQKTTDGEYVSEYALNPSDFGEEDTFTQTFAEEILSTMQTDYYNDERTILVAKYNTDDNVKTYSKRYSDLILD